MTITLHHGDCREVLPTLPAESVQCVVTSPPYFGLRDYGVDGQIGLEPSPQEYVDQLVAVFREVRRVLRKDGTAWLNIGDSYNNFRTQFGPGQAVHGRDKLNGKPAVLSGGRGHAGLKEKDLMLIPARVALALQADGWWVRSEIIWSKAAPMPESVRDRPTCAHEKVWLLTKSATYFYDADAVREPFADERMGNPGSYRTTAKSKGVNQDRQDGGFLNNGGGWDRGEELGGRNLRNVWHLNPAPFPGTHFATMPSTLAERCIKAGTSEKGCCPTCGAAWVRLVEREVKWPAARGGSNSNRDRNDGGLACNAERSSVTTGWSPSCACPAHDPVPCTVLDPFAGAGTTLLVADRLQRNAIGIELNPAYATMGANRVIDDAPLFANVMGDD